MAAPRSPTPVSELKSNEPLLLAWVNPLMTCCGTPAALICGMRLSWNDVAKIVPTKASAIVPPIWRKNVRFDVATPSCWNGTAFWMTIVGTENVVPTPRPAMNIHSQTTGTGVSLVSWVISSTAKPMTAIEPTIIHL